MLSARTATSRSNSIRDAWHRNRLIGYDRQKTETTEFERGERRFALDCGGYTLTPLYEVVPLTRGTAAHTQMPTVAGEASERC